MASRYRTQSKTSTYTTWRKIRLFTTTQKWGHPSNPHLFKPSHPLLREKEDIGCHHLNWKVNQIFHCWSLRLNLAANGCWRHLFSFSSGFEFSELCLACFLSSMGLVTSTGNLQKFHHLCSRSQQCHRFYALRQRSYPYLYGELHLYQLQKLSLIELVDRTDQIGRRFSSAF